MGKLRSIYKLIRFFYCLWYTVTTCCGAFKVNRFAWNRPRLVPFFRRPAFVSVSAWSSRRSVSFGLFLRTIVAGGPFFNAVTRAAVAAAATHYFFLYLNFLFSSFVAFLKEIIITQRLPPSQRLSSSVPTPGRMLTQTGFNYIFLLIGKFCCLEVNLDLIIKKFSDSDARYLIWNLFILWLA